jgi:hypothetical protein
MQPKKPTTPNPGIPLRDPRDRSMFGPLPPDAPPLPPEPKPPRRARRDSSPDVTNRSTPAPAPLPRREA